jgi:hypothetical protein
VTTVGKSVAPVVHQPSIPVVGRSSQRTRSNEPSTGNLDMSMRSESHIQLKGVGSAAKDWHNTLLDISTGKHIPGIPQVDSPDKKRFIIGEKEKCSMYLWFWSLLL